MQDAARFQQVIKKNKITKAVVILDSGGGFLDASLAIGATIKLKGASPLTLPVTAIARARAL